MSCVERTVPPGGGRSAEALRAYGVALAVFLLSLAAPRRGVAAVEEEVPRLLEELAAEDAFTARRAEVELRRLGDPALVPLARALQEDDDRERRFRVHRILDELLETFLLDLENQHRSLAGDRRELERLRERQRAREDLERLRPRIAEWKEEIPRLEEKVRAWLDWRSLEEAAASEEGLREELEGRRAQLAERAEAIRKEVPDIAEKAEDVARWWQLRARAGALDDRQGAEALRVEELEERIREREPAVEELVARARTVGPAAFALMAKRRSDLPVRETPRPGEIRSPVQLLYDELLTEEREAAPAAVWDPPPEAFERRRWVLSWLWRLEAEAEGPHAEEAGRLLDRHLEATIEDLDDDVPVVRERAGEELYRLERRGLRALVERLEVEEAADLEPGAGRHAFLAGLLRWRIAPSTYATFGIHFGDYRDLSFTARRRKIFQYARAAGTHAVPTLRAIVLDDALEDSFLVKYAAAKALAGQLGDRLGYMVLKSLHPGLVLERPEVSRDLHIIQGLAHVRAEEYAAAIEEFRKILDELPFDFEANYHIAFAYLLQKNYPKSIHHFEIARRVRPGDQLTLYNLACAYSLGGHPDDALDALEASVDAGFHDVEHMESDPDLDPIRDEDRFDGILSKARAAAE